LVLQDEGSQQKQGTGMTRILILLASLLVVGNVYALPPCSTAGFFHNCFATYIYPKGSEYVGEYKDGIPHGQGSLTFDDGSEILGEWKSGKPWNVVVYDSSGKFNHNYKDGVPQ
jgi:hypothetical protein|tara:strand:+ start:300 stop:641 length:342 start_codon:yes stop_codon:yes gene_type:complete